MDKKQDYRAYSIKTRCVMALLDSLSRLDFKYSWGVLKSEFGLEDLNAAEEEFAGKYFNSLVTQIKSKIDDWEALREMEEISNGSKRTEEMDVKLPEDTES